MKHLSIILLALFFLFACKESVEEVDTCSNGLLDFDEITTDCGDHCPPCPPSCSDGIQNQDETFIDCGGSICGECFNNLTECNIPENKLTFDGIFYHTQLTDIECDFLSDERGMITATNSQNTLLTIIFPSDNQPSSSRLYKSGASKEELAGNELFVEVRASTGSEFVFYYADAGYDLVVEVNANGLLKVLFCDVLFQNYNTNFGETLVKGSVICD